MMIGHVKPNITPSVCQVFVLLVFSNRYSNMFFMCFINIRYFPPCYKHVCIVYRCLFQIPIIDLCGTIGWDLFVVITWMKK